MLKSRYTTKEIFEDLPIGKSLAVLALPAIAGQLITLIYNIADTFFIGRVNNPLMITATSLCFPIFCLTSPLSIIPGSGGGTLVSRLMGQGRNTDAKKVATFSIYLGIALGLAFSLIVYFFMDPLLKAIGASDEAFLFTKQYLTCIVVFGGVPTILQSTCAYVLRSTGQSKTAGFGVAMGGIINIILDPIMMFVILPKGYEVVGAGLATMISNICAAVFFLIKIKGFESTTALGLNPAVGMPGKKLLKEIFVVGLTSATMTLLFDINNFIIIKLMSAYGDIPVAAIGMTIKIERFSLNICVGLCMGMTPLVAYNYAAGNKERMLGSIKVARRTGIIISLISICLYELFAPQLNQFFINDPETIAVGAAFLRRRAIASVFMFLGFYMPHVCQGVGDGKMNFIFSCLRYVVFCIPALFVGDYFIGMNGLALAQFMGDVANSLVAAIIFSGYLKKKVAELK